MAERAKRGFGSGGASGIILLLSACASTPVHRPGIPTPTSVIPAPTATTPAFWTLNFLPGALTYRITRNSVVENRSDSSAGRQVTANSTHETITLQQSEDAIAFTASVDTFSTTVQRTTGLLTQQPEVVPFQLSGQLIADTIRISSDSLSDQCSPVAIALATDIHNLLPRFPRSLTTTSKWTDSTETMGCQAGLPIKSRVIHSYAVAGQASYDNATVLVIQRLDSIHAEGEGAQRQHRVMLTALGTGAATYYLDIASGHVVRLTVNQDVELTITASGKASHFSQNAKQEFTLGR